MIMMNFREYYPFKDAFCNFHSLKMFYILHFCDRLFICLMFQLSVGSNTINNHFMNN